VTTRKGSGLAQAVTTALNAQIDNGHYGELLTRWNLTSEGIKRSETNPPGLPKG
jgi:polar amino acid transport system substrate-binding protein